MKNLIYFFLLISFFSFSQEEKRLALVIGNSNYDSITKLANPVNDAKLIAKTLDSLDFEVILATDLDEENFMIKIIEFRDKRKNYDVGFVYYAGHGIQIDGENYLLPVNKNFDKEWKVKKDAINVNEVMDYLTASTDQVNILILDACRNNPWEGNFRNVGGSKNGGLAKIPVPTGSLIAFSTNAGEVAADGDGENSIYCKSLVKNMSKKGISIDQVFRNVRSDVLIESKNSQRPVEFSQLTGQAFYLLKRDYDEELKRSESLLSQKKINEAIYLLETIYKSDSDNLDIVNLLSKSYNKMGSQYASLDGEGGLSQEYFDKSYGLLAKYIPVNINNEILNIELIQSEKIAQLFYRKSRLLYLSKINSDWEQIFLNMQMAVKYDLSNPYWNYYLGTIYYEQYPETMRKDSSPKATEQYELAIEKYLKKINSNKNISADDYFYLGYSYYNIGNNDLAFDYWNSVLAIDPENVFYLNFIANSYSSQGSYKKALEIYDKIISICNECAETYNGRGYINLQLQNFDDAINDYSVFFNLTDQDFDKNSRLYRGLAYFNKASNFSYDKSDLSIENYINAIKDFDYSINYLVPEQSKELLKLDLNQILDDNLIDVDYLIRLIYFRAEAYFDLAGIEKSLQLDYYKSLNSSKNDYKFIIDNKIYDVPPITIIDKYLRVNYLEGNYSDLIRNANNIIYKFGDKLTPSDLSEINSSIGMTYWTLNDNVNALIYYKKSMDLVPSSENYGQYAVALFETGDYENSLIYFNKTIEKSPNNDIYWNNRGMYYYETKDYDKAEQDFLKSLSLNQNKDLDGFLMLLKINIKRNNYKKQLKYAFQLLDLSDDIFSNYWISEIYQNQDRYLKAIIFISKVIDIKKTSDVVLVSYENYSNSLPEDSSRINLSELYKQRGDLFKFLSEDYEACEDYNVALDLADKDSESFNEIQKLISENCGSEQN